ncbi:MAG: VOC family protein [Acidimicrobiales bacterium]
MHVRWLTAFLDFPAVPLGSFARGCAFWQSVTSSRLSPARGPSGEFATLLPPRGDAYLRVQRTGRPDARCHLDLHVDDVGAAVQEAVDLGALATGPPAHLGLTSPGGFPFCVVRGAARPNVRHLSPGLAEGTAWWTRCASTFLLRRTSTNARFGRR